nr:hypothetical protein [uncultured Acinetobacter sp.]
MFKVGDKTVKINKCKWSKYERGVYTVELVEEERIKVFSPDFSHSFWVNASDFRIANKEEIAAGHRIDLEELRDCDTSPNCKKYKERVSNNETN